MLRYTGTWEQLEQMGFVLNTEYYVWEDEGNSHGVCIEERTRELYTGNDDNVDTLFDLIKSGLVEKVVQE